MSAYLTTKENTVAHEEDSIVESRHTSAQRMIRSEIRVAASSI